MYEKFIKILDWFEKFFKRFKALGYLIAIIFVIIYFVNKGFEKKEAIRIAEKITGLNLERDLLLEEKKDLKKERLDLLDSIYNLNERYDSVIVLKDQEAWRSAKYRRERDEARREIRDFTPTERYVFLDETAYPYTGEKIYPFNARQMEGMHETFIENEYNKEIVTSQAAEIDHCNDALALAEGMANLGEEAIEIAEEEIKATEGISAINEEKADIAMKQWKKERRKKIWNKTKTWIGTAAGFAAGFILGGK